jgi:hypothetical protein
MNSIAVARVQLDGRHVSGLRYDLEDARLVAGLLQSGAQARLYGGKSDGRIVDLCRQLVRMRTDAYVFQVCRDTLAPTLQLVEGLAQMRPGLHFFLWGGIKPDISEQMQRIRLSSVIQIAEASHAEQMLLWLKRQQYMPLVTGGEGHDVINFSPYITGLVPFEEIFRLGLTARQSSGELMRELTWLAAQPVRNGGRIMLDASHLSDADLPALCKTMISSGGNHEFVLRVSAEAITGVESGLVKAAHIARIEYFGELPSRTIDVGDSNLGITMVSRREEDRAKTVSYGSNGIAVLHAGAYLDGNASPATYHLELSLDMPIEQRRAAYRWAGPNMAIRSAAVVAGRREIVARLLPTFEHAVDNETHGWPKHVYASTIQNGLNEEEIFFDGNMGGCTIGRLPLSQLARLSELAADKVFITLREAEDIDELERRLARFHEAGTMQVNPVDRLVLFENTCRWMGARACGLPLLRRLEVHNDGGVSSCRDAGEIGRIGDSFDQLGTNVRKFQQLEDVRRGCAVCPVRDQCSHCVQLPRSWGSRYCSIRQTWHQTTLFFELMSFPFLARQMLPGYGHVSELHVSYTGLPRRHYHGPIGEMPKGAPPVLVDLAGQELAWWRGTRKIMRLSTPLALMMEAWWCGATVMDVERELSERFDVDAATARAGCKEGQAKLRDGGLIGV